LGFRKAAELTWRDKVFDSSRHILVIKNYCQILRLPLPLWISLKKDFGRSPNGHLQQHAW
jgi:hypothetical protein